MTQLTEDDSWAATVLGKKANQSGASAIRHVLTNVLGARPDTEVHLLERERHDDETLLLCSDGLHGSVPQETLLELMATVRLGVPELAQRLVTTALECGSRDNITALVVRCSGK